MATFKKIHVANRGTATYRSDDGLTVNVPKSVGDQPETLEINGLTASVKTRATKAPGAPKQTPEERKAASVAEKARFAALTPEAKAQELRQRAADKRERAARALAAADARLNKIAS